MELPFNLHAPSGYQWLIDQKLVGFENFTQLQPWRYMTPDECFFTTDIWPGVCEKKLFIFARRQDNDDLACFEFNEYGVTVGVVLIHGWTDSGFDVICEYNDFWSWLQSVINDIALWAVESE